MMKTIFATIILLVGLSLTATAQETERKLTRSERKALAELLDSALHVIAVQAIADTLFTLEANNIQFKSGHRAYVNSNSNFVSVVKKEACLQVAFGGAFPSPNGLGGVTVEGTITGLKTKTSRKGDVTVEFKVMGTGVSATVIIKMERYSNRAELTVLPNFSSHRLTYFGVIVPLEESMTIKGRSI